MKRPTKLWRAWATGLLLVGALAAEQVSTHAGQEGRGDPQTAAPSQTARDSAVAAGERQMRAIDASEAIATFGRLVSAHPSDTDLRTRLGHAYLRNGDYESAEKAFEAAIKLDKKCVAAHVGLGLTFAEMPAKGIGAFYNYRRALGAAKRATKLDSTYGLAYRLLGEIHEQFKEDHGKAIHYYQKYVELAPGDPDGLYQFGLACVQGHDYDSIERHIEPYLAANPQEIRLLPLVAQAHFYKERHGQALELFERHLQNLSEEERGLYTDISMVASRPELKACEATTGEERLRYLDQFWTRRDPDILTPINERIIEHYRRVWFARTYFAEKIYPWDTRGEVYIRYGEPEYRSRSYQRDYRQSPEVEAVRTQMAVRLYGPEAAFLTFTGPVFPIKSFRHPITQRKIDQIQEGANADFVSDTDAMIDEETQERDEDSPETSPLSRSGYEDRDMARFDEFGNLSARINYGDYSPVTIHNDMATVPWEAWTYTQVQGGIEIVFTDDHSGGRFDFAPQPPVTGTLNQISNASRLSDYAPEVVYQRAAAETPDYYRPGIPGEALEFYYDLANFRGSDGQTVLEVYYGIPMEQVELSQRADSALVQVQVAMGLADETHTSVYRQNEEISYVGSGEVSRARGAFVPQVLKTELPPGEYELQVQVRDRQSGHVGLYRQDVEVSDFRPEALQMSDVILSSGIGDTQSPGAFRKQDVWIVPMPSRTYAEAQKVYAYYEIYNLAKNAFGQAKYKVKYTVRSTPGPSIGVFGAVSSGFHKLFSSGKPQVSVTYDQEGMETTTREYFELDLTKAKPGVQVLGILVEDRVSGQSAKHEIRFRYGE